MAIASAARSSRSGEAAAFERDGRKGSCDSRNGDATGRPKDPGAQVI